MQDMPIGGSGAISSTSVTHAPPIARPRSTGNPSQPKNNRALRQRAGHTARRAHRPAVNRGPRPEAVRPAAAGARGSRQCVAVGYVVGCGVRLDNRVPRTAHFPNGRGTRHAPPSEAPRPKARCPTSNARGNGVDGIGIADVTRSSLLEIKTSVL
jgi:hypothetical protein